jgi:hypothetical protein
MADVIRVPGGYRFTGPYTQEKQDAVTVGGHLVAMASARANGLDPTLHNERCSACRGDVAGLEAVGYTVGVDLRAILADPALVDTGSNPSGGESGV